MMRIRSRSRSEKWLERIGELPWWQRSGALAVPAAAALGAVAYAGRRRVWRGIALVASGVEAVADTIEDAAEGLRDNARKRAGVAGT
ncbi:MAG: hypothetical protein ACRDKG_09180 [Actinomycetota bacterium]